jgi:transcriptional regulator with XRE-family HTH domain
MEDLVAAARHWRGWSQRELARAAGVPVSTVNRIETGKVSPTVEMVTRLVGATGLRIVVSLTPTAEYVRSLPNLNESERRSLVLGVLTAARLVADPATVIATARRNLVTMADAATAANRPYLDAWSDLLDGPTETVVATLTGLDAQAKALRQATPFGGVVPQDERRAALDRLRAS